MTVHTIFAEKDYIDSKLTSEVGYFNLYRSHKYIRALFLATW